MYSNHLSDSIEVVMGKSKFMMLAVNRGTAFSALTLLFGRQEGLLAR